MFSKLWWVSGGDHKPRQCQMSKSRQVSFCPKHVRTFRHIKSLNQFYFYLITFKTYSFSYWMWQGPLFSLLRLLTLGVEFSSHDSLSFLLSEFTLSRCYSWFPIKTARKSTSTSKQCQLWNLSLSQYHGSHHIANSPMDNIHYYLSCLQCRPRWPLKYETLSRTPARMMKYWISYVKKAGKCHVSTFLLLLTCNVDAQPPRSSTDFPYSS